MKEIYEIINNESQKIKNKYINKDGEFIKKEYEKINTIIRVSEHDNNRNIEVIFYNESFKKPVIKNMEINEALNFDNDEKYDFKERINTRKYKLINDVATPITENAKIGEMIKNIKKGDIRAIKSFHNYALNNEWEYFTTFTFADEKIRNDRNKIKELWNYFRKELRLINPDFKAIAVMEPHENGGFHLHALIKDIDLPLMPARNNNKESKHYRDFLYTDTERDQIFNTRLWKNGLNTIVCIRPNESVKKVSFYLSKYITKTPVALYGEKRFFKTQNLTPRYTELLNTTSGQQKRIIEQLNLKLRKSDYSNNLYYENSCLTSCQSMEFVSKIQEILKK